MRIAFAVALAVSAGLAGSGQPATDALFEKFFTAENPADAQAAADQLVSAGRRRMRNLPGVQARLAAARMAARRIALRARSRSICIPAAGPPPSGGTRIRSTTSFAPLMR